MGEAKRRRDSGEMDYWFHGTNEHFLKWATPPVISTFKPELTPHPFICLTKRRSLASETGVEGGGMARARLTDAARCLDLRQASDDSRVVWELIRTTEVGRLQAAIATFDQWLASCNDGFALRPVPFASDLIRDYAVLNGYISATIQESLDARMRQQNYIRQWINIVMEPVRKLGYNAAICCEAYKPDTMAINLHVFDPVALTPPEWLTIPDPAKVRAAEESAAAGLAAHGHKLIRTRAPS